MLLKVPAVLLPAMLLNIVLDADRIMPTGDGIIAAAAAAAEAEGTEGQRYKLNL
jgi:hypothetical protein